MALQPDLTATEFVSNVTKMGFLTVQNMLIWCIDLKVVISQCLMVETRFKDCHNFSTISVIDSHVSGREKRENNESVPSFKHHFKYVFQSEMMVTIPYKEDTFSKIFNYFHLIRPLVMPQK